MIEILWDNRIEQKKHIPACFSRNSLFLEFLLAYITGNKNV